MLDELGVSSASRGIGFERGRPCAPCGIQSRSDQRLREALPAITLAHIEAGKRPDRRIFHLLEPPRAIQPRQHVPRRQLTPAHSHIPVEGEPCSKVSPTAPMIMRSTPAAELSKCSILHMKSEGIFELYRQKAERLRADEQQT